MRKLSNNLGYFGDKEWEKTKASYSGYRMEGIEETPTEFGIRISFSGKGWSTSKENLESLDSINKKKQNREFQVS